MANSSTEQPVNAAMQAPDDVVQARAELASRMLRNRVRLALRQPFLASALFRLTLVEVHTAQWCPTMATDGVHVFYNPQWVLTLTDSQIQAVMAHELLHVVMNHNARQQHRDAQCWNMACDFCINGILQSMGFDLPPGGLVNRRFDKLGSEEIYELLQADWKSWKALVDSIGRDLVDGNDPRISAHVPPDAPDAEAAHALRTALQESVRQAMKGAGTCTGAMEREFERTCAATVDWRAVLQNLLQSALVCDWASIPFAKKHLHRGLYLPSMSRPAALRVVFAIDTSGSVDDRQIGEIMNELLCFADLHEGPLSVVQCDSEIRHILHINETPAEHHALNRMSIKGRGGTAFVPVFEWIEANAQTLGEIALLVYATDGLGLFPNRAPAFPVLWLLSDNSTPVERLPFGTGVRIGG